MCRLFLVFLLHRILYHCFLFIYTHVPLSFSHSSCDKKKKNHHIQSGSHVKPTWSHCFFTSIDLQNNSYISLLITNKSVTKSCCCPASTISLCSNISTANNLLIITVTNSLYLRRLNTIFANNKQTYSVVAQK